MTFLRRNNTFILALIFLFGFSFSASAAYPFGDELIRYQFEDAATATSTNSGTSTTVNDGTFFGNASTTAIQKKFGARAGVFGETNDWMQTYYASTTPVVNPTTQSISVSLWVYKGTNTCTADDDHIFGTGNTTLNNRFYIRCINSTTNRWSYRIGTNANATAVASVSTTTWDHIVLVANSATDQATFYVNNVALGPAAYTSFNIPGTFFVGNYNDASSAAERTQGGGAYVDEVAIYGRALTAADVNEIYQAGQVGGAVSALTATGYDQNVYLAWTAGSGTTTDYLVEYKLTSEPTTWTTFNHGSSTASNITVTGLSNGSAYDFRVTPRNIDVFGSTSNSVSATPTVRIAFVSPTPTDSSTVASTTITASASTSLPTTGIASSTQILQLETQAGSIVQRVVSPIRYGDYNVTHLTNTLSGSDLSLANNSSGIAYVGTTDTLFIVHNNTTGLDSVIEELDKNGTSLRTITCTACGDIESIVLLSSVASSTVGGYDHTFMLGTENAGTTTAEIFRVLIHSTGSVTVNKSDYYLISGITHGSNSGLEGIAYNPTSGVFYVAREHTTPTLYEVTLGTGHAATGVQICTGLTLGTGVNDFSDLFYKNGTLYVSGEDATSRIIPINITSTSSCAYVDSDGDSDVAATDTGNWLTVGSVVGVTDQIEGLTWDDTGDTLYVLGEADFLGKYRSTVFSSQYSFTGLANGNYVLKSAVLDANGITSSSTDRAFTISVGPVITAPTLTVQAASAVTTTTATLNGTVTADNNASSTARGFEYGLTTAYGATTTISSSFGVGAFSDGVTGLTPGTLYHYRAYATNSGGVGRSGDQTFTTASPGAPVVPTLTMSAPSIFAQTTAYVNANMTDDGNASSTERGFRYGLTTTYTATSSFTGTFGVGSFDTSLTGLVCATTYHVQAYAINSQGMGTASDVSFTTSACSTSGGSGGSSGVGASGGGGAVVVVPPVVNSPLVPVPGCPVGFVCTPTPGALQQPQSPTPVGVNPIAAQVFANMGKAGVMIVNIQSPGRRNVEIINIQKILNVDPSTRVAAQGPGSPGKETNLFGPATRAAVQKFQLKYGIVKSSRDQGYGVVGPKTKAMMNALLGRK